MGYYAAHKISLSSINVPNVCICVNFFSSARGHNPSTRGQSTRLANYYYDNYNYNYTDTLIAITTSSNCWLNGYSSVKSADQSLYADIPSEKWNSVDKIFQSTCRPDLVLVDKRNISILELTICHETNLEKSKQYKSRKYQNIHNHIQPHLRN